jgi:hypothetical protein
MESYLIGFSNSITLNLVGGSVTFNLDGYE